MISKVLEIKNCNATDLLNSVYKPKLWEEISPVTKIEAKFIAPNVLQTVIVDEINIAVKIPIEMRGELVLNDKGEQGPQGRLIEFNVRNNKDVKDLEGNLRIKQISPQITKVGIFIHSFTLGSDFLKLFGKFADIILQTKISAILRKLEAFCLSRNLKDLT